MVKTLQDAKDLALIEVTRYDIVAERLAAHPDITMPNAVTKYRDLLRGNLESADKVPNDQHADHLELMESNRHDLRDRLDALEQKLTALPA